jgi:hypothetical protein
MDQNVNVQGVIIKSPGKVASGALTAQRNAELRAIVLFIKRYDNEKQRTIRRSSRVWERWLSKFLLLAKKDGSMEYLLLQGVHESIYWFYYARPEKATKHHPR